MLLSIWFKGLVVVHSKVQCGDGKQNLFTFECCLEVFCVWSCQCLQRFLGANTLLGDLGCPGRMMLMVSQVMHRRRRWLLWCDFNCTSPLQPPSPLCCYDTHIEYCTVLRPLSHSTFFCFPICTILLHHQVGETFAETGSGLGLGGWVGASQVSTTEQLHAQMHFNGWGLVQISSKLQSHR